MSAIISIGNEILLGKTLNTNLQFLASELAQLGLAVDYSVTIKDDPHEIRKALTECWARHDVVITTGGLGPTADDITKAAIADFFGQELVFQEEIWEHVKTRFSARGLAVPDINRNQALVPSGFTALRNDQGTAPGLCFRSGDKTFFALPGVPLEMEHLFSAHLRDILRQRYGARGIIQRNIHTHGISESALAEILAEFELPPGVNLAWLPQTGRVDLRLYGSQRDLIDQCLQTMTNKVKEHVWGFDADTPTDRLGDLMIGKGWTITCAESCTGGLLQKMLTDRPGSSAYFQGGVVSYSNRIKSEILGVPVDVLSRYGAVSAETAAEMATGLHRLMRGDVAVSVTGIAGPEGESPEKPVGLVYFGFVIPGKSWTCREVFQGTRVSIRHKAAEYAMITLIRQIQEL